MTFGSKREAIHYVVNNYPEVDIISERIYHVVFINSKGESFLQVQEVETDKWELVDERKASE